MEVETIEPSEPVLLKKRGRPKGYLNKITIQKMTRGEEDVEPIEPDNNLERAAPDSMMLDVEFTSDKICGEKLTPKRKPRAGRRPPPTEPSVSESGDDTPPPPPPPQLKRQRSSLRIETTPPTSTASTPSTPSILDSRPSYLEVLTRGLKEARAKQYAEKVAQYDRFFQW